MLSLSFFPGHILTDVSRNDREQHDCHCCCKDCVLHFLCEACLVLETILSVSVVRHFFCTPLPVLLPVSFQFHLMVAF